MDPPDGRAPLRPEAIARRALNLKRLTDSWEFHTPWERCITRAVPGGMLPAGYNNGYRITQTADYITILYEMIHEPRIIPLDGRPHVDARIRLWNGDSRGRWENDTLVVDVTELSRGGGRHGCIGHRDDGDDEGRPAERGDACRRALHANQQ